MVRHSGVAFFFLLLSRRAMWLNSPLGEFRIIHGRQRSATFSGGFCACRNPNNGSTRDRCVSANRLPWESSRAVVHFSLSISMYIQPRFTSVFLRSSQLTPCIPSHSLKLLLLALFPRVLGLRQFSCLEDFLNFNLNHKRLRQIWFSQLPNFILHFIV